MVVAVLEARAGLKLGQHDIYLNVAGGLRVNEPAADLAAAAALVSSLSGNSLPGSTVFFGEIGLSGAVRPVPNVLARLKEAAKLGFTRAVTPALAPDQVEARPREIAVASCADIASLTAMIAAPARRAAQAAPYGERDD
jgi:DNA repair protein RadA/Sms